MSFRGEILIFICSVNYLSPTNLAVGLLKHISMLWLVQRMMPEKCASTVGASVMASLVLEAYTIA